MVPRFIPAPARPRAQATEDEDRSGDHFRPGELAHVTENDDQPTTHLRTDLPAGVALDDDNPPVDAAFLASVSRA